jgi:hypothetical protein
MELMDGGDSFLTGVLYQNLIVRTRTPFAQLVPVLATVFGNEFSTMIILFTPHPYWRRRGDLIAFGVKAASKRDQQIDLWLS